MGDLRGKLLSWNCHRHCSDDSVPSADMDNDYVLCFTAFYQLDLMISSLKEVSGKIPCRKITVRGVGKGENPDLRLIFYEVTKMFWTYNISNNCFKHSWTLNNTGLNRAGPFIHLGFAIVNTVVLHNSRLVESTGFALVQGVGTPDTPPPELFKV